MGKQTLIDTRTGRTVEIRSGGTLARCRPQNVSVRRHGKRASRRRHGYSNFRAGRWGATILLGSFLFGVTFGGPGAGVAMAIFVGGIMFCVGVFGLLFRL